MVLDSFEFLDSYLCKNCTILNLRITFVAENHLKFNFYQLIIYHWWSIDNKCAYKGWNLTKIRFYLPHQWLRIHLFINSKMINCKQIFKIKLIKLKSRHKSSQICDLFTSNLLLNRPNSQTFLYSENFLPLYNLLFFCSFQKNYLMSKAQHLLLMNVIN